LSRCRHLSVWLQLAAGFCDLAGSKKPGCEAYRFIDAG